MTQHRILIPLFTDYYLFDYFRFLVPQLLHDGFSVTVLTFDQQVKQKYGIAHERLRFVDGPKWLRYLSGRSGLPIHRIFLWSLGRLWARNLRKRYHFAILPWDNKPLWYMIARAIPSITCHNSSEFYDVDQVLANTAFDLHTRRQKMIHEAFVKIDRLLGGRLLPRVAGQVTQYQPLRLVIDRVLGNRAANQLHGFSGALLSVTGHQNKENLCTLGLDPAKIFVVGHPGYDTVFSVRASFDEAARRHFKNSLHIPEGSAVFCLFLSPSKFSDVQIAEIETVVRRIADKVPGAFFVLKFHPKTAPSFPALFRERFSFLRGALHTITEFKGDEYNAQLILIADLVVQKQSTVGFLAMLFEQPLLSYNLMETDYHDDMYKHLDASWHVENVHELDAVIDRLNDPVFRNSLVERQRRACHRFCLATDEANRRISQLIRDNIHPSA